MKNRKKQKIAYTIVHTAVDVDKGHFPAPVGLVTYIDQNLARSELYQLVEKEKEEMDIPFDTEEYREEYDDDFWEAYRDGYAAGWFTRYEIIESPLSSLV